MPHPDLLPPEEPMGVRRWEVILALVLCLVGIVTMLYVVVDNAGAQEDPRDTNGDGYVDCSEDPEPDENDVPCGFRDGVPVGCATPDLGEPCVEAGPESVESAEIEPTGPVTPPSLPPPTG